MLSDGYSAPRGNVEVVIRQALALRDGVPHHDMCRPVTGVFLRAGFRLLKGHARAAGAEQPRAGAVAVIHRFGGGAQLATRWPLIAAAPSTV
jgi:hypothetical protein